nr:globin domain-containing protein [uncultured Neokomagataea sp.]
MIEALEPGTVDIVQATIPALEAHGVTIAKTMYASLMQSSAIAAMFNQTDQANARQPQALAAAVLAYARHIEHPEKLEAALDLIVERHASIMVKPEHYPVVGEALLGAIKAVLGGAATPAILQAWGDAYRFLADALIAREARVYAKRATLPGGWRDWRSFRVAARVQESDTVVSFWLVPVDGQPVLRHQAGQSLTFRLDCDGVKTRRSYSISSAPSGEGYRISVKRDPHGLVSCWFHDKVNVGDALDVTPPAGNFTLQRIGAVPVVLVSAGIGITPFLSMLLEANAAKDARSLQLIHGDHDLRHMPFGSALAELVVGPHAPRINLFGRGGQNAGLPITYHEGRISAGDVFKQMALDTHVFICGPRGFQRDLIKGLHQLGVEKGRIHHEFFGSSEEIS